MHFTRVDAGDHIVSIVAMKSYAEAEKSRDHLSRDFLGLFDFRLLQQYRHLVDMADGPLDVRFQGRRAD
jgi:hypothetical protein